VGRRHRAPAAGIPTACALSRGSSVRGHKMAAAGMWSRTGSFLSSAAAALCLAPSCGQHATADTSTSAWRTAALLLLARSGRLLDAASPELRMPLAVKEQRKQLDAPRLPLRRLHVSRATGARPKAGRAAVRRLEQLRRSDRRLQLNVCVLSQSFQRPDCSAGASRRALDGPNVGKQARATSGCGRGAASRPSRAGR
jgi:hypothetical protein